MFNLHSFQTRKSLLKFGIFSFLLFSALNKTYAQEDSLVQNYYPETLWYLQKETWITGAILISTFIIGVLYRMGKARKKIIIKTTSETELTKKPQETENKPNLG